MLAVLKDRSAHRCPLNECHGLALQRHQSIGGTELVTVGIDADGVSAKKVRSVSLAQHALQIRKPHFSSFLPFSKQAHLSILLPGRGCACLRTILPLVIS